MADDLGWADVGYNGAEFYETPHIDKLRASGMALRWCHSVFLWSVNSMAWL